MVASLDARHAQVVKGVPLLEYGRLYNEARKVELDAYNRQYKEDARLLAMHMVAAGGLEWVTGKEVLGCSGCGCDDWQLLEINHVNGGGSGEVKRDRHGVATAVLRGRAVDDLDLKCRPCNALSYLRQKYPAKVAWPVITWGSGQ